VDDTVLTEKVFQTLELANDQSSMGPRTSRLQDVCRLVSTIPVVNTRARMCRAYQALQT
jgi:hypothetical protein